MSKREHIKVDGRELAISNLRKVFFPDNGFTKGEVIAFYSDIAETILPHLRDRPLTLKRYPDGIEGKHFYEKNAPSHTPSWVRRFAVPRSEGGPDIHYILCNDLATLVWVTNLGDIEKHVLLARAPAVNRPTAVVFDLDPGEPADIIDCGRVALHLKELLGSLNLEAFVKVSGSKGLHLAVPLNTEAAYESTQPFAKALADLTARQLPDCVVSEMSKTLRRGKVLIDWSQNSDFKTTVCVYAMRAKPGGPFISMPISWDDLAKAVERRDTKNLFFTPAAAVKRVGLLGDLFEPVLTLKQGLPGAFIDAMAAGPKPRLLSWQRRGSKAGEKSRRQRSLTKESREKDSNRWLPNKEEEKLQTPSDRRDDTSALSGRSMRKISEANDAQQRSNRLANSGKGSKLRASSKPIEPAFIEPMQCKPVAALPGNDKWTFEIKFDGYRCIAVKRGLEVALFSRNKKILNKRFPEIGDAVAALKGEFVLDGELVAFDPQGRPSFQLLQGVKSRLTPTYYFAFDLLNHDGEALLSSPLEYRRSLLAMLLASAEDPLRLSAQLQAPSGQIIEAVRHLGLEGIVGKRIDSVYEPGQRSGAWIKYPSNKEQEFVIGGYVPGSHGFDALVVGVYEKNRLMFVAKVKNGFLSSIRRKILPALEKLKTSDCPFANLPEERTSRWGEALTAERMKECRWIKPNLVCQVAFVEWTDAGHLRHCRFVAMRDDKKPAKVVRET